MSCSVCKESKDEDGLSSIWVLGISLQDILESTEGHAGLHQSRPGVIAPILSVRTETKSFQVFLLRLSCFSHKGQQKSRSQCWCVAADKQWAQTTTREDSCVNQALQDDCLHVAIRVWILVFWEWSELIGSFPLTINNVPPWRCTVDLSLPEQLFVKLWSRGWINCPNLETSQL